MSDHYNILDRYFRFADDINRNLYNIIHLTNNLRYNTFQLCNNYSHTQTLTNDIFFPSRTQLPLSPPPPPPLRTTRRRVTRSRRQPTRPAPRTLPRRSGLPIPNEVFRFVDGPTEDEITQFTESLVYSDISTNQLMCPIQQRNFTPTDRVLRIRHCGHVFVEDGLRRWFRSSSECPVCRFNIRPVAPSLEAMIRNISTQTYPPPSLSPTDISNNSTNVEYSFYRGGVFT